MVKGLHSELEREELALYKEWGSGIHIQYIRIYDEWLWLHVLTYSIEVQTFHLPTMLVNKDNIENVTFIKGVQKTSDSGFR